MANAVDAALAITYNEHYEQTIDKRLIMLYAHTSNSTALGDRTTWQPLVEHLENVARMASDFAEPTHMSSWAYAAGILHDLGKADIRFQRRLEGSGQPFVHSTAGAVHAQRLYAGNENVEGDVLAPLILGHHGGLANYRGSIRLTPVAERLEDADERTLEACRDLLTMAPAEDSDPIRFIIQVAQSMSDAPAEAYPWLLFVGARMLFSSLVDADWLDTERVMNPDMHQSRMTAFARHEEAGQLLERFSSHVAEAFVHVTATPINRARATMKEEALRKAELPPGMFTLEMPTGSGKTLTSMEFALRHTLHNKMKRIIYAIPFMSIVEQTAHVFKELLGQGSILEHFSSYDYGFNAATFAEGGVAEDEMGAQERLLAQNWDAPIIVTTNVQLFESLFSNRVVRSRKVHNVANSVIVLDEVQTLPSALLKPTLAMLQSLVAVANVSVVLCTATQPSLDEIWPFKTRPTRLLEDVAAYDDLFRMRVSFDVDRALPENSYSLDELSEELLGCSQVLCVVSTRRAARMAYDALEGLLPGSEGLYHLSALMVPEHRAHILAKIRARLLGGLSCHVISTQLIEAGVDVDFPVVYREMAGIDSILQAAGRCNREGRMTSPGEVHVFCCAEFPHGGRGGRSWLARTRDIGTEVLERALREGADPFGRESVAQYFKRLHQGGDQVTDAHGVYRMLSDPTKWKHLARGRFPYESVAKQYRFITDDSTSLFVPWEKTGRAILARAEDGCFDYRALPAAHRHSLSIPIWLFREYEGLGLVRHVRGFPLAVLEMRQGSDAYYDDARGLLAPGEGVPEILVV